jgi:hypothetical protein
VRAAAELALQDEYPLPGRKYAAVTIVAEQAGDEATG